MPSDAGGAARSPPRCPGVDARRVPCAAPSSSRSPWPSRSRAPGPGRRRQHHSRGRPAPPSPSRGRPASPSTRPATTTTGTCAASSAPPAPSAAPSSDLRSARRKRRFTAAQVERKVMRLAAQRDSLLAREVRDFIKEIRSRPRRHPDPRNGYERCLSDTRLHMDLTRDYLAETLGVGDSDEEWDSLERCVERLLFEPLYDDLYKRAILGLGWEACVDDMQKLVKRHNREGVPFSRMGAPALSTSSCDEIRTCLNDMCNAHLPLDKLTLLIQASERITILAEKENGITIDADNLLAMMSWNLVHANMIYAIIEAELLRNLIPPEKETGKAGFYMTVMYCASRLVNSSPDSPASDACDSEAGDSAVSGDEIQPAVSVPSDADDDVDEDDGVQKAEPRADGVEDDSEGYCSDPDRERPATPVKPDRVDTGDSDSCFGDDERSYRSDLSLSSWSSKGSMEHMCRSYCDLSSAHCSAESLPETSCAVTRVAQLGSAGTLFSAVPVFLSRALVA